MNEPKQGHQQQQQASTDTPNVKRDPMTGINQDMPADPGQAGGFSKDDPRWGNKYCR